jgi:hypothetical protein
VCAGSLWGGCGDVGFAAIAWMARGDATPAKMCLDWLRGHYCLPGRREVCLQQERCRKYPHPEAWRPQACRLATASDKREKTDIPTLLSADILALRLQLFSADPLLWNIIQVPSPTQGFSFLGDTEPSHTAALTVATKGNTACPGRPMLSFGSPMSKTGRSHISLDRGAELHPQRAGPHDWGLGGLCCPVRRLAVNRDRYAGRSRSLTFG